MAQIKDAENGLLEPEQVPLLKLQPLRCREIDTPTSPANGPTVRKKNNKIEKQQSTESGDSAQTASAVDECDSHIATDNISQDPQIRKMLDAIECDDDKEVERILNEGADPNAMFPLTVRQEEYLCAMHWDDDLRDYRKICSWRSGRAMWTMLQFASAECSPRAARALLARGARSDGPPGIRGALDVAGAALDYGRDVCAHRFAKTVKLLIDAGAKCRAGAEGGTSSLHAAARLGCARAAAALLAAGARVVVGADGRTPLHVAVDDRNEHVLQTLLDGSPSSANAVDRCGNSVLFSAVSGEWCAGAVAAMRSGADATSLANSVQYYTPLHLAIKLKNAIMVDQILTLAKDKDVNCLNKNNETPLYTAIESGQLTCVKLLLRHGASLSNIKGKNNALHVASFYSYPNGMDILQYLPEVYDVSDMINELNDYGFGPIHRAVIAGHEPVKVLLDNGADVRLRIKGENTYSGFTPLHYAAAIGDVDAAKVILEYDRSTMDDVDVMGRTPLFVAVLNKSDPVVTAIIRAGGLLSCYTNGCETQSAIEMITRKLPQPTEFFKSVFDSFLYETGYVGSTDVVVNYKILGNYRERNQLKVIEELTRCGERKVLVHPLIETFLFLKWKNLLPIFYILLWTSICFVVTFNIFIVTTFFYHDRKQEMPDSLNKWLWVEIVFLYISICLIVLQESLCIHSRGCRYWWALEAWVKLGAVSLGAVLPPLVLSAAPGEMPRHAATAALLLSWLEVMFLFSRFPRWGYYILMVGKVASDIAKILITSIFLVLAFALSFMVQFQATPPFDGAFAALTKTAVMMASEFDYEDLFGSSHDAIFGDSKTIARLLFITFLIFVSIVLMNFIIGVAVTDINNLTVTGNIRRLEKQLESLTTLDALVCEGILGKILPKSIVNTPINRRFLGKIVVNPGTTKIWTVYCEKEDHNYQIRLPTYLYRAAVATSRDVGYETDFNNRKLFNMVKMLFEAIVQTKENVDPYSFCEYVGVNAMKSKFDDILEQMKTLDELKVDLRKLKTSYCYNKDH